MSQTVTDRTVEFVLTHSEGASPPPLETLTGKPIERQPWREAYDDVQKDVREAVWSLKTALDGIEPKTYTLTRNRLFPLAVSGHVSRLFSNRAGYKLTESMEACGVWQQMKKCAGTRKRRRQIENAREDAASVAFADICGGPGSFAEALMTVGKRNGFPRMQGFGMTLANVDKLDWYPDLIKRGFTVTYGVDGTGDIFKLANIEALETLTRQAPLLLAVADGGFDVDFSVANYQETISARILYGQWLAAVKVLKRGGSFVLKLFDTFAPSTRALLYVSTFLFDRVHVVKPKHSRVVNSERYFVGLGAREVPPGWMAYLEYCYTEGFTDNDHVPTIIPSAWMQVDDTFMKGMEAVNASIAKNQMIALQMVIDAAPGVQAQLDAQQAQPAPTQ